jgi:nitrate/nitrite transporter NarK
MPTQSWKPLLNAPRCSGGAISDRYSGTACVYVQYSARYE